MLRLHLSLILLLCCGEGLWANDIHPILFYNVENLFDCEDDPLTRDDDFTPRSKRRWGRHKYARKVANISYVMADVAAECGTYPTFIALAEVENRAVVERLASSKTLQSAAYSIVHYDSPDERGIDVALLYRTDKFSFEGSMAIRSIVPSERNYKSRDILTVWGQIGCEPLFFIVTHWSSRVGGVESTRHLREANARQIRHIADSVARANPSTKIIIAGDMNDNPTDKSIYNILGAKESIKCGAKDGYFNPFWALYREGYGTTLYRDNWYLFDNIIVSSNLIDTSSSGLTLQKQGNFYGHIFKRPYMIQNNGLYKGNLLRGYQGGYSDHLPVYLFLIREQHNPTEIKKKKKG